MNQIDWKQVGVFAVVALLVFLIGASRLGGFGGYGPGIMGPGMMGRGMMGGWGFGMFGGLGMIFMWLVPLGFLALLIAGISWTVSAMRGWPQTNPQARTGTGTCPSCKCPIQDHWQVCPNCGQKLA